VLASSRGFWAWPKCGVLALYEMERLGGKPCAMRLRYTRRPCASGQTVNLEQTPAHFGGSRVWFLCPGCGRRSGRLYLPPRAASFLCRLCHDLTYESAQTSGTFWDVVYKADARRAGVPSTYIREALRARHGAPLVSNMIGRATPLP